MKSVLVLLEYPTIIEVAPNKYEGFLTINEQDFAVAFKQTEDNKVIVNYKKSPKLVPYRLSIDLFTNNNTYNFLSKLEEFLGTQLKSVEYKLEPINYKALVNDYSEFCKFYYNVQGSSISTDLRKIVLCYKDQNNRKFSIYLQIFYTKTYFIYKIIDKSIPSFEMENCSSLITIYNSYTNLIESPHMQTFFAVLDEIDANCWILDPEKPSYKETYRRIVLETNTSALLNIYENNAKGLPEIKIFGSHHRIQYFTDKIVENISNWEPDNNIIEELLKLFDISEFPTKPLQISEDCLLNDGECCICFALRLENILPDVVCSNTSCNQIFHQKCLFQWLSAINAESSVYEIYGPCPNCEKEEYYASCKLFLLPRG